MDTLREIKAVVECWRRSFGEKEKTCDVGVGEARGGHEEKWRRIRYLEEKGSEILVYGLFLHGFP